MEIKVLGTGCARCKLLYREAENAIAQSGQAASLMKVEAVEEMMAYGILTTPALVIDGRVVSSGRVPRAPEIVTLITQATARRP